MIIPIYAGILGLLFAKMSLDTIGARRKHQVSLGVGPNREIENFVSAHANFAAYVPVLLILAYLLEISGHIPAVFVHLLCMLFTLGRVLHYAAFCGTHMNFKLRVMGMQLTLWPLIVSSIANIVLFWI